MNIFITGKMTSGKTTVADFITKHYFGYEKISLADPIKDIVYKIDSMGDEELIENYISPYYKVTDRQKALWASIFFETRYIPKDGKKERARLQFLGTEGGRERIDKNLWVDILINKTMGGNYVVDDCRFVNEANSFTNAGWIPIFLYVEKEDQYERIKKLYGEKFNFDQLNHGSEVEINKIKLPTESFIYSYKSKGQTLDKVQEYLKSNNIVV